MTGKLATAYIRGMQSRGVGATAKHFVGEYRLMHVVPQNPLTTYN